MENVDMVTLDALPNEHSVSSVPQSVLVQQSSSQASGEHRRAIGFCGAVLAESEGSLLNPGGDFSEYLYRYENITTNDAGLNETSVVTPPAHGALVIRTEFVNGKNSSGYYYTPEKGYVGDEKIVFKLTSQGTTVYSYNYLKVVVGESDSYRTKELCNGRDGFWKISSNETPTPYSNLLNDALSAFKGFTDLPAGEVGNTIGSGINASISLDINAAGNGWYQSANPFDNSDLLPTADANIWVAKAGRAADGKMDLLSVLLHEYGHALGLDHGTAATYAMAVTLKVGEAEKGGGGIIF